MTKKNFGIEDQVLLKKEKGSLTWMLSRVT